MKLFSVLVLVWGLTSSLFAQDWGDQIPPEEVEVQEPLGYDGSSPTPLIIFLHGYSPVNGGWTDAFTIGIADPAYYEGYLFAAPDGSYDSSWLYYWNASDACCDFDGSNPDHVGYINAVVDAIQLSHNVDPKRVHIVGYSNGGFMAHRLACESPDKFASMISISGVGSMTIDTCVQSEYMSILQIHGTLDPTILYNGGHLFGVEYPGAEQTMSNWAKHVGCKPNPVSDDEFLNLDINIWGSETEVVRFNETCKSDNEFLLWKVHAADHTFWFWYETFELMFQWLDDHQKPNDCVGDFDGNAVVDVNDLLTLINAWGTQDGDLDGDLDTNVNDVLVLLGGWGDCP